MIGGFAPFLFGAKMNRSKMNQTTYHRMQHNKEHPYVMISRSLVKDNRLSASAIGLMSIILSNRDDFILNVSHLKRVSQLTKTQFYKAWNTLQEYQYIIQKINGTGSWHYIVNENPNSGCDSGDLSPGAH